MNVSPNKRKYVEAPDNDLALMKLSKIREYM
jgi:hypothetical protein